MVHKDVKLSVDQHSNGLDVKGERERERERERE
jgi:hypothetical protein